MYYRSVSLIVVSAVMGFLAIIAVVARFWVKHERKVNIASDDYLVVIGLVRLPHLPL